MSDERREVLLRLRDGDAGYFDNRLGNSQSRRGREGSARRYCYKLSSPRPVMAACGTFLGYPTTPHTPSLCFFFFVLPRGLGDSRINPWRLRQRSHSYCVPTLRTVAARAKGHPVAVSRDCDNRATICLHCFPRGLSSNLGGAVLRRVPVAAGVA